jgi:hypothetical protein
LRIGKGQGSLNHAAFCVVRVVRHVLPVAKVKDEHAAGCLAFFVRWGKTGMHSRSIPRDLHAGIRFELVHDGQRGSPINQTAMNLQDYSRY